MTRKRELVDLFTDEHVIAAESLTEELRCLERTDPALWLEFDRQGSISPDIINRLRRAGFFRILTQPDLGGFELDLLQVCRLLEQLAAIDGSLAWLVMAGNGGPFFTRLPPAIVRHQIFGGNPDRMIAGNLAIGGTATRVPGGFLVNGQWSVASGVSHCDWVIAACAVRTGDREQRRADGSIEQSVVWVPRKDVEVIENWQALGLRATASHDFAIRNCFVPSAHAFSDWSQISGERTLVATPIASLTALMVASVLLGIAGRSVELVKGLLQHPTRAPRLRRAQTAHALGEAAGKLEASRQYMYQAATDLWGSVSRGARPAVGLRVPVRLAAVNAAVTAGQVARAAFELGGLAAAYPANRIEKALRDVMTGAQHAVIQPGWYEQVGQFLLGLNAGNDL